MINTIKSLKNHEGFMKYFKNTSWLFGEKILRMVVGLFVGIWVARYLGPEQFGLFSYAQSFVGLFSAISTLGLDSILIRELVKEEKQQNELIGTVFWMKIIGAIIVLAIVALAVTVSSNDSYTNTLIFIIASATVFQSFNVIDMYFQSKVMSKYVVYVNTITLLTSSVLKIIFILNDVALLFFAWLIVFDAFILASGLVFFYVSIIPKHIPSYFKFKIDIAFSLLKDSWPLMIGGLIGSIYMKIDQVMIKEMLNNAAVGQYAVAVKLSEAWYFLPMIITASLFPAIINAKKHNKSLYYSRLQKLYDFMVWTAIMIAIPMSLFSDWIIIQFYGKAYIEAGSVLMIHIWSGVFIFLGFAFSKYLTVENLTKKSLYRTLLGALINIYLNYLLIPNYGIIGAAYATLLGQVTANYLYDIFDKDMHEQLKMKSKAFFPIHYTFNFKQ